jgi:hypothetical protein
LQATLTGTVFLLSNFVGLWLSLFIEIPISSICKMTLQKGKISEEMVECYLKEKLNNLQTK